MGLEADFRTEADAVGPKPRVAEENDRTGRPGGGVEARVGRNLRAIQIQVDLIRGANDRTPVKEVVPDEDPDIIGDLSAGIDANLGNNRELIAFVKTAVATGGQEPERGYSLDPARWCHRGGTVNLDSLVGDAYGQFALEFEEHFPTADFAPESNLSAVKVVPCVKLIVDCNGTATEERRGDRQGRVDSTRLANFNPFVELQPAGTDEHLHPVVAARTQPAKHIEVGPLEAAVGRGVDVSAGKPGARGGEDVRPVRKSRERHQLSVLGSSQHIEERSSDQRRAKRGIGCRIESGGARGEEEVAGIDAERETGIEKETAREASPRPGLVTKVGIAVDDCCARLPERTWQR